MSDGLQKAGLGTRLLYAGALLSIVPGTMAANSGWIVLATGGSIGGRGGLPVMLLIAAALMFRCYQVIRYPYALAAYPSNAFVGFLRGLSKFSMLIGFLAGVSLFLVKPITLLIFKTAGDSNVGFFVVGFYLSMLAPFGWMGCVAFEITRKIGRRPDTDTNNPFPNTPSQFHWKQDAVVAIVLIALIMGVPYLRRANAPAPCGQSRITCIATLKADVRRMISAPLGTPVYLESTINAVRMQIKRGSRAPFDIPESPSASLLATGYLQSDEPAVPLRIRVSATESDAGVVLDISVSDSGEETAHFTATFPRGSRLERTSDGLFDVVAELPYTSDGTRKGAWRDAKKREYTLDQLFVFFRQAIGTEIEARENRLRKVITPVLVASETKVVDTRSLEEIRGVDGFDKRCDGRIAGRARNGKVRSYAESDRGWELSTLEFTQGQGDPPHTYMHNTDRLWCPDETMWILHQVPIESFVSFRRFAADGTLLRFVESRLPSVAGEGRLAFLDPASVREEDSAIWLDRLEAEFRKNAHGRKELTVIGRDRFRIPLE